MNNLFVYLSRFNRQEQTLLLLGGVAVLLFVLWMVVLAPIQSKRDSQLSANVATSQSYGRVQVLAAKILQARNQGAHTDGGDDNISRLIDASLRANGLSMSGFQPGTAGEVRVRLERAAYKPLMQWLYELEFKHNIVVRDLSIATTNDPGQVTVNIRLLKQ